MPRTRQHPARDLGAFPYHPQSRAERAERAAAARPAAPHRRAAARQQPAPAYPPGHFSEPARAWWGAAWEPVWPSLVGMRFSGLDASAAAMQRRETFAAEGRGWGSGTIQGIGATPMTRKPHWLDAAARARP